MDEAARPPKKRRPEKQRPPSANRLGKNETRKQKLLTKRFAFVPILSLKRGFAGLAIPGDPKSDWIEARRQLLAEIGES